jgi:hypothetical protein
VLRLCFVFAAAALALARGLRNGAQVPLFGFVWDARVLTASDAQFLVAHALLIGRSATDEQASPERHYRQNFHGQVS